MCALPTGWPRAWTAVGPNPPACLCRSQRAGELPSAFLGAEFTHHTDPAAGRRGACGFDGVTAHEQGFPARSGHLRGPWVCTPVLQRPHTTRAPEITSRHCHAGVWGFSAGTWDALTGPGTDAEQTSALGQRVRPSFTDGDVRVLSAESLGTRCWADASDVYTVGAVQAPGLRGGRPSPVSSPGCPSTGPGPDPSHRHQTTPVSATWSLLLLLLASVP